ncbi:MlaD family protein [Jongsikchunia kroppenstedtii]|uniref:MlaD family protein n=1 Tax=Jongsikchunia kroppenstedtii TaxID=1121721 RepID=UPI0004763C90|nr:MlaD family protein [Jongsikchunia kroppenstedtii]
MISSKKAGVRLVVFFLAVVMIVFLINQAITRPISGSTESYHAEFTDAFGLRVNNDVRIRGVQVGKVRAVTLRDGKFARVTFTMQRSHPLGVGDIVAIKFQNLTGQRYLAILPSASGGPRVNPAEDIPPDRTLPSLDITQMFNGLQPILKQADPAIYNRLAMNMLALLEGEQGDGVASVMSDIGKLAGYASDRSAVFEAILSNLGRVANTLTGHSKTIDTLLSLFGGIFHTLSGQLEKLLSLIHQAAAEFSGLDGALDALQTLALGGSDKLTARFYELVPDPAAAVKALEIVPPLISGLTRALPNTSADLKCSKGNASLPGLAKILIGGQEIILCKP